MGDVLGIGNGIISRGRGGSKRLEVAPADPEVASWVGAAIGEGAFSDGAADGLGLHTQPLWAAFSLRAERPLSTSDL